MTAQPISSVPSATKAPSALSQSGHGVGAFIDHLGSDAASQSTGATISTGRTQISAWHKTAKPAKPTNDSNPTATQSTAQVAALAQPVQAASSPTPAGGADTTGGASNAPAPQAFALGSGGAVSDPGSSATARAAALLAANAGNSAFGGFGALLNAGASISPFGQKSGAASPGGASLGSSATTNSLTANGVSLPTSLLAQVQRGASDAASTATPSPLPPGTATTQQTGQAGATFGANQFGAPGATATSAPAIAAALDAAAAEQAKQSTAAQAPDGKATDTGSAATPADAEANAATNISTLPGAAALNARIVAGATNLSVHPNQAATASATALAEPQDPNAGAMPPSAGTPDLGGKPGADAGIAAPAANAANANGLLTGANPATDPRGFAAAVEHATLAARDVAAGAAPDDTSSQSDGGSNNGDTASSSASLLAATTNASTNSPAAAPTNATPQPGMIALPASEQVAINMRQALKVGANEIQIQLKPESLGVIDVKLNVDHDGRLSAVISANHPETLNLLKQDSSNLQQSLRDAGFNADSGSLSFNLSGDAQSFAQNTPQQGGSGSAPALPSAFGGTALATAAAARAVRQHLGALDIHV
jgi:flagellar hook-length control protein FliK